MPKANNRVHTTSAASNQRSQTVLTSTVNRVRTTTVHIDTAIQNTNVREDVWGENEVLESSVPDDEETVVGEDESVEPGGLKIQPKRKRYEDSVSITQSPRH